MGQQQDELGGGDAFGEASDIVGTYAQVLQAADQVPGASRFGPAFLPGSTMNVDLGAASGVGDDVVHDLNLLGVTQSTGVTQAFNGLGALTSGISAVTGGWDMMDDQKSTLDRVIGGGNFASGLVGTASGIAGMSSTLAEGSFLSGLANAGGAAGLGADITAGATWGAGAGAAGAGTALATGASVLSAGLAGYGVGHYGDQNMANLGLLHDEQGRSVGISDWGADLATRADEGVANFVGGEQGSLRRSIGSGLGTAAGLATVAGTSIAGVPMAIASTGAGIGQAIGNGVSSLYDWATGP